MAMISEAVPNTVLGDAQRLEQVLINLISNAFKFTDEGQVVLTVEAFGMKDYLVELRFAVTDTGIGVPLVFLDHRLINDKGRKPAEQIREAAGDSTPTIVRMLPYGSGGEASIKQMYRRG